MVMLQISSLHRQANTLLSQRSYPPKKLVLLHTAISLGCSLLLTLMNYLFSLQIADTGGLGGMGLRSLLATAQSVLELAVMVALPFWEIGLLYAALHWARGTDADFSHLSQGFRRFGSVLGYRLLHGGVFVALGMAVFYTCTTLFMMTPWAKPVLELFAPIADTSITPEEMQALLTPELMSQAAKAMTPLFILFGVVFIAIAIPVFYRLRLAQFAVMDGMPGGRALVHSLRITKKNVLQLVKLDLHFWWFYLLQLLCLALSYGDAIAQMAGIPLPLSQDGGYFLFYVAGALCQGVLVWQCQGPVFTTFCLAYDSLNNALLSPETAPQPANVPWEM